MIIRTFHYIAGNPPQTSFRQIGKSAWRYFGAEDYPYLNKNNDILKRPRVLCPGGSRHYSGNIKLLCHVWEYQTGRYGCPVVINTLSAIGCGRAHGFSEYVFGDTDNVAELAGAGRMIAGAENFDLLDVDTFMGISGWDTVDCPEAEWVPAETDPYGAEGGIDAEDTWKKTLLTHYWKQASIRAFSDDPPTTVRVNLGEFSERVTEDIEATIKEAKRFFSTVIAPALPQQVQNIASMAAGVNCSDQCLLNTAIEFDISENGYEEETLYLSRPKDLRQYRLTQGELDFISEDFSWKPPEPVYMFFLHYKELIEEPELQETSVPFMADYRVWYALYCIDRIIKEKHAFIEKAGLMNEHGNPKKIRDARACYLLMQNLRKLLEVDHRLNDKRRNLVTELTEELNIKLMKVMLENMAEASAEPFLLHRNEMVEFHRRTLYNATDAQVDDMIALAVADARVSKTPQFVRCYSETPIYNEVADERNAKLLAKLLRASIRKRIDQEWNRETIGDKYIDQLRSEDFADKWACLSDCVKTKEAVADFLREEIQDVRKHFLLYKISLKYIPENELLKITLNHFIENNTMSDTMPDDRQIKIAVHGAQKYIANPGTVDSECVSAMNRYYQACFEWCETNAFFKDIVRCLGGDTTEAMVLIFDKHKITRNDLRRDRAVSVFETFGGENKVLARKEEVIASYTAMLPEIAIGGLAFYQRNTVVKEMADLVEVAPFDVDTSGVMAVLFSKASEGDRMTPEEAENIFTVLDKEQKYCLTEAVSAAYMSMLQTQQTKSLQNETRDREYAWGNLITWISNMVELAPFEVDTSDIVCRFFESARTGERLSQKLAKDIFTGLMKYAYEYEKAESAFLSMIQNQLDISLKNKDNSILPWISDMMSATHGEISSDMTDILIKILNAAKEGERMRPADVGSVIMALKDKADGLDTTVQRAYNDMLSVRRKEAVDNQDQDGFTWLCDMEDCSPWSADRIWLAEQHTNDVIALYKISQETEKLIDSNHLITVHRWVDQKLITPKGVTQLQSYYTEQNKIEGERKSAELVDTIIGKFEKVQDGKLIKATEVKKVFDTSDPEMKYRDNDHFRNEYRSLIQKKFNQATAKGDISSDELADWMNRLAAFVSYQIDLSDCVKAVFEEARSGSKMDPAMAKEAFSCVPAPDSENGEKVKRAFDEMLDARRRAALAEKDTECFGWLCNMADASPWKTDAEWLSEQHTENMIFLCDLSNDTEVMLSAKSMDAILGWIKKKSVTEKGLNNLRQYCDYWAQYGNSIAADKFGKYLPAEEQKTEKRVRFAVDDVPGVDRKELKELLDELDSYVGLRTVKEEVSDLLKKLIYSKKMMELGVKQEPVSLHMVFTGNPGTGKTTVARLIAKIFYCMGLIKKGGDEGFVETNRQGLVASYVGQTATKTKEVINKAIGGVLFIDEAYALKPTSASDFGREAIDTLLLEMENHRSELVVIVAGYTNEMDQFIDTNPGLQSRFNRYIHFDDYDGDEMFEIFVRKCRENKLIMTPKAGERIREHFRYLYSNRNTVKGFANARTVRNFFEKLESQHATRVIDEGTNRPEDFFLITVDDVEGLDPERTERVMKEKEKEKETLSLQAHLDELNNLVGLSRMKEEIDNLVRFARVNAAKKEKGLQTDKISLHMVFSGNPGTGKTTVARIVAEILHDLGYLTKDSVIETARQDLVAGYSGQTAIKVQDKVKEALGGVLFIDEAYSLKESDNDSFGQEAIDTLVKCMEDNRNNLAVIVAGYTKEMDHFMAQNSGLQSRFSTFIHFDDYSAEELNEIFIRMCESGKSHYQVSADAKVYSEKYWQGRLEKKDERFGNAREVRKYYEAVLKSQNSRLSRELDNLAEMDVEMLTRIELADLQEAARMIDYEKGMDSVGVSRISEDGEEQIPALEKIEEQLNNMIGLDRVKEEIRQLTRFATIKKLRQEKGMKMKDISLNMVFTGNPGTGKTTVARIVADILKSLGYLSKGQLIEVSRGDMIGGYMGQTAIRVQEKIKEAKGGVLFIDEAYSLKTRSDDSFGQEAIDTLVKCVEDNRKDLAVIVAGYPEEMEQFLSENPGLRSRFNTTIHFDDYTAEQLYEIFINMTTASDEKYFLTDESQEYVREYWQKRVETKDKDFGNAREVRNYYEKVIKQQTDRLGASPDLSSISDEDILRIELSDVQV